MGHIGFGALDSGDGEKMRCVGILGGSFDPIHLGHLRAAREAIDTFLLDEIYLMPSRVPPHREQAKASPVHRSEMILAALEEAKIPQLSLNTWELERAEPAYSIETIRYFHKKSPDTHWAWILGMDAFSHFLEWGEWEEILKMAHLIVLQRGQFELNFQYQDLLRNHAVPETLTFPQALRTAKAGFIFLLQPETGLQISSSAIRKLLATGRSPQFLLPDAVLRMIEQEMLYSRGALLGGELKL